MLVMDVIVRLALVALVLGGCISAGSKTVKVAPSEVAPSAAAPEAEPAPAAGKAAPAGDRSFAYQIAMAGLGHKMKWRNLPPQQHLESVELKNETDKSKRYTQKYFQPDPDLLGIVGMGLSLGLAPGLGAPATAGNIARVAAGPGLMMAGGSRRSVSAWEQRRIMAWILPWLPAQEAATPQEAVAKVRQTLEQAAQGQNLGTSTVLDIPLPTLDAPPAIVSEVLQTRDQVWTWSRTSGIQVTASGLVPKKHLAKAIHDDVGTWKQISSRLPRWCFVVLGDTLTANGQHFVGYPQVLWQGQAYYFGQP